MHLQRSGFAGVSWLAGVDPTTAFIYLQPLCAVLAIVGAYAVAYALTGWRTAGYLAALLTAWDLFTLINGLVMCPIGIVWRRYRLKRSLGVCRPRGECDRRPGCAHTPNKSAAATR